ncbi:MAG: DegV family EDD domain-containing protein [Dehalococcoidia bacterium]|nr:DegV family EDD domain-containing protein [Dehalococcoidia bacterium]
MTVAVVIDSSSAMTQEVAANYHIRIVPLTVLLDGKEYTDWIDWTVGEFYERLKTAKAWPKSSGSAQGQLYKAFEELRDKVDGIAVVAISPASSPAFWTSALGAKGLVEDIPIEIIDSNSVIAGHCLVATAAARAALAGASLEDVVKAARSVIPKVNYFFNVGSIEYFVKGGHATALKSDPKGESHVLTVSEGKVVPFAKYPTRAEARDQLRRLVEEKARKDTPLHASVFHAAAKEEAEEFKKEIASEYTCAELFIAEATPVLALHVSPDSLGVAFYNE